MKILITEIVLLSKGKYRATMAVDGLTIRTEIIENSYPIRSFNFSSCAFKDVLEMAGQMTCFLKGYWQYRDGRGSRFPWVYSCPENDIIEKALKYHGLRE